MFGNMVCCQLAILRCMYGIRELHYVASCMRRVVTRNAGMERAGLPNPSANTRNHHVDEHANKRNRNIDAGHTIGVGSTMFLVFEVYNDGPVAQWIRRRSTEKDRLKKSKK